MHAFATLQLLDFKISASNVFIWPAVYTPETRVNVKKCAMKNWKFNKEIIWNMETEWSKENKNKALI